MNEKINRILYYEEFLSLAVLLYFAAVIPLKLTVTYAVVFTAIFVIKSKLDFKEQFESMLLLPTCILLMEVSVVFLTYTGANTLSNSVLNIGGIIFLMILIKSKISFDQLLFIVLVSAGIGTAGSLFLYAAFGVPSALIETAQLLFVSLAVFSVGFIRGGKAKRIVFTAVLIFTTALLVKADEFGSLLVVLVTSFFAVLIFGKKSEKKAVSAVAAVFITAFLVIFFNDAIYDYLFELAQKTPLQSTVQRIMERVFIKHSQYSQFSMLHEVVFENQSVLSLVTNGFGARPYVEILAFGNGENTGSADYLYSLWIYFFTPFSLILTFLMLNSYKEAVVFEIEHPTVLIPIFFAVKGILHIGGNLAILPFTGIPLPFCSFGKFSLTANIILLSLYSKFEFERRSEL